MQQRGLDTDGAQLKPTTKRECLGAVRLGPRGLVGFKRMDAGSRARNLLAALAKDRDAGRMTLSPGSRTLLFAALVFAAGVLPLSAAEKLKALIIDGQNNHDWKATTPYLKSALEQSGRFTVEVSTTPGPFRRGPDAPKNAPP